MVARAGRGITGLSGLFGLASPATGTHDVVVSFTTGGQVVRCIAQSLVNVRLRHELPEHGSPVRTIFHRYNIAASSASNHLVMDVAAFHYAGAGCDSQVNGDNTLVDLYFPQGTNNPAVAMSYAAGAATVNMGWTWTLPWYGHGHGMYMQAATAGQIVGDNIVYDQIGDCTVQAYGSSSANFIGVDMQGNAFVSDQKQYDPRRPFRFLDDGHRDPEQLLLGNRREHRLPHGGLREPRVHQQLPDGRSRPRFQQPCGLERSRDDRERLRRSLEQLHVR